MSDMLRIDSFGEFVQVASSEIILERSSSPGDVHEEPLLNGLAYRLFRQSLDIEERRKQGTFFSGPKIAGFLASTLRRRLPADALVMDPTCGLGDLLLAYAAELPLQATLDGTLADWGAKLAGLDLNAGLVRMAKTRLVMLARSRGKFTARLKDIDDYFPLIRVGDMLSELHVLADADGFLFNPPFGQTSEYGSAEWGSGNVNAAATFLAAVIENRKPGAPIAAVLPEVLRCGSRYERFREHLEAAGLCGNYRSCGRFDTWTDVDVFTTLLTDDSSPSVWRDAGKLAIAGKVVSSYFDVRVGAVVPHRNPELGPWSRYICAKSTPAWATYMPNRSRRFKGTTFQPPFVVVRRTSSPSDRQRAVATIITGDKRVAVENHLLVLLPKDQSLEACENLLNVLRGLGTTVYLNETIRCRHLTTASVGSIPWNENNG
ncbi:hypothetical protein BTE77_28350 [Ensifer adhaerens]|nr:hypothetical protein BTE77_28350 [Ensifer adhaerens]